MTLSLYWIMVLTCGNILYWHKNMRSMNVKNAIIRDSLCLRSNNQLLLWIKKLSKMQSFLVWILKSFLFKYIVKIIKLICIKYSTLSFQVVFVTNTEETFLTTNSLQMLLLWSVTSVMKWVPMLVQRVNWRAIKLNTRWTVVISPTAVLGRKTRYLTSKE